MTNPVMPVTIYRLLNGAAYVRAVMPQSVAEGFKKSGVFTHSVCIFEEIVFLNSSFNCKLQTWLAAGAAV
jgi:hypothetical protein